MHVCSSEEKFKSRSAIADARAVSHTDGWHNRKQSGNDEGAANSERGLCSPVVRTVCILIIFTSIHSSLNLSLALFNDFLGVHDPLPVSMVLTLSVPLEERVPPRSHSILHLILFVLNVGGVRLIEVGNRSGHFLTIAEELGLLSVVVLQ